MDGCSVLVKGSLVRVLFAFSSSLVCVCLVGALDARYWLLWAAVSLCLLLEGIYTLAVKKHGSWKWFSPTVALFIVCTVPCLWLIEFDIFWTRRACALLPDCESPRFNGTALPAFLGFLQAYTRKLTLPDWSLILHQNFLFTLILGRWLLPKGELSRDQLSQLLLVQIGMAADILEFITEGLKVPEVYERSGLPFAVLLTVWTVSLPQFTLSLTLTSARKRRPAATGRSEPGPPSAEHARATMGPGTGTPGADGGDAPGRDRGEFIGSACCHVFCGTEVWAILVTLVMQDLPFLGVRLSLMLTHGISLSIPLYFFTFKNALVSALQIYRLAVILRHHRRQQRRTTPTKASYPDSAPPRGAARHGSATSAPVAAASEPDHGPTEAGPADPTSPAAAPLDPPLASRRSTYGGGGRADPGRESLISRRRRCRSVGVQAGCNGVPSGRSATLTATVDRHDEAGRPSTERQEGVEVAF